MYAQLSNTPIISAHLELCFLCMRSAGSFGTSLIEHEYLNLMNRLGYGFMNMCLVPLAHDVGRDITPCNEIDKPLMVYRLNNVT